MRRSERGGARGASAARVAVVAVGVAVGATVLVGLGHAEENPEDGGSGVRAALPAVATTRQSPAQAPVDPPLVAGTPCTATARACVALDDQLAWLIDGGAVVRGPVRMQHGDAANPTPKGTFTVQWKAEEYTSREYLTQMPYSVFFADGGIAFHEGAQNRPSAGCVKLGYEDAEAFFYFLYPGDEVQIH